MEIFKSKKEERLPTNQECIIVITTKEILKIKTSQVVVVQKKGIKLFGNDKSLKNTLIM